MPKKQYNLEYYLSSASKNIREAILASKIALQNLEYAYDEIRDRDYLTFIEMLEDTLKKLTKLKEDIDYEINIL